MSQLGRKSSFFDATSVTTSWPPFWWRSWKRQETPQFMLQHIEDVRQVRVVHLVSEFEGIGLEIVEFIEIVPQRRIPDVFPALRPDRFPCWDPRERSLFKILCHKCIAPTLRFSLQELQK